SASYAKNLKATSHTSTSSPNHGLGIDSTQAIEQNHGFSTAYFRHRPQSCIPVALYVGIDALRQTLRIKKSQNPLEILHKLFTRPLRGLVFNKTRSDHGQNQFCGLFLFAPLYEWDRPRGEANCDKCQLQ